MYSALSLLYTQHMYRVLCVIKFGMTIITWWHCMCSVSGLACEAVDILVPVQATGNTWYEARSMNALGHHDTLSCGGAPYAGWIMNHHMWFSLFVGHEMT